MDLSTTHFLSLMVKVSEVNGLKDFNRTLRLSFQKLKFFKNYRINFNETLAICNAKSRYQNVKSIIVISKHYILIPVGSAYG